MAKKITPSKIVSQYRYKLIVAKSPIDNRGLFTKEKIPARVKIGNLGGEVISQKTARERAKTLKRIAIVELSNGQAIDAGVVSDAESLFKYINHSCSANCYIRVFNYQVEFYARRNINVGEELTCNYGETHHDGKLPCQCGSSNCVGKI